MIEKIVKWCFHCYFIITSHPIRKKKSPTVYRFHSWRIWTRHTGREETVPRALPRSSALGFWAWLWRLELHECICCDMHWVVTGISPCVLGFPPSMVASCLLTFTPTNSEFQKQVSQQAVRNLHYSNTIAFLSEPGGYGVQDQVTGKSRILLGTLKKCTWWLCSPEGSGDMCFHGRRTRGPKAK